MQIAIMELDTPHARLAWARERKYDTPLDAARALGVPEATYYGHENGNRGLTRAARRYADFFGVNLEWLLYGRGTWNKGVSDNPLAGLEGEMLSDALRYIGNLKQIQEMRRRK